MNLDPKGLDPMSDSRLPLLAGLFYLLVIAGGIFAELFVREALFVSGDAAATARSIAANESLWRWGIAVHASYLLPGAAFSVILYRLFRTVEPTLALLALVLSVGPIAMEGLLLTTLYVPLVMMGENAASSGFDEGQRQALGYLAVRLFFRGWNFGLLLFSGFCTLMGVLILRSRLVPRFVGVLMIAAGAGYVINSLTTILAPPLNAALQPWVLVPCFLGEFSLALALTIRGIRATRAMPSNALPRA